MDPILVVEDDPRVQKALRRQFEPEGYEIDAIADGASGLKEVLERPPAAVVLDLRLPALSGKDVCREIKQAFPNLPVIIVSATSDTIDKVSLLEPGADDYVTKRSVRENCSPGCGRPSGAHPALPQPTFTGSMMSWRISPECG